MPNIEPVDLMRLAIAKTREGIAAGQSPFGCAIAMGGEVLACSHNSVLQATDITAHAEMNAIRAACRAVDDIFLTGAIVVSTCEPCPMCMAALHWARVEKVYFGSTIADAEEIGFNELRLPAAQLIRLGGSEVRLEAGLLAEECRELFREWMSKPRHRAY